MTTIKKVYIVSSGDYSDYSIQSIFLEKDEADAYANIHNTREGSYLDYRVEEHDINPASYLVGVCEIIVWHAQHVPWKAKIENNSAYAVWKENVLNTEFDMFKEYQNMPTPAEILTMKEDGDKPFDEIIFNAWSDKSEEHAKKKLYDYKAKMKALWEGIYE